MLFRSASPPVDPSEIGDWSRTLRMLVITSQPARYGWLLARWGWVNPAPPQQTASSRGTSDWHARCRDVWSEKNPPTCSPTPSQQRDRLSPFGSDLQKATPR